MRNTDNKSAQSSEIHGSMSYPLLYASSRPHRNKSLNILSPAPISTQSCMVLTRGGSTSPRICLHRKKINLSTVFAGQALGIKEVEEGIWLVSFMEYDLGYIDLEEKTLQPLDNPFGPKV